LGVVKKQQEVKIVIPAGIDNGEMIRLSGQGEAVPGGVSGDLYVKIHIRRDPTFVKDGNDIRMDLKVKLSDALLGGEYSVATLDGDIKVKIPAGVAHGEVLRVKGKGVPIEKNKRGDLLIRVGISLPGKLSGEAKRLVEALRKEGI
jgi:molecular chaperone DnaJ